MARRRTNKTTANASAETPVTEPEAKVEGDKAEGSVEETGAEANELMTPDVDTPDGADVAEAPSQDPETDGDIKDDESLNDGPEDDAPLDKTKDEAPQDEELDEASALYKRFAESKNSNVRMINAMLTDYAETMKAGVLHRPEIGAGKQRELLNAFTAAFDRSKNAQEFKEMFDVINTYFKYHGGKDGAFNGARVQRFFEAWTGNERQRVTLSSLCHILVMLADPAKRKENMEKLDIRKALDAKETILSNASIGKVVQYYK